MCKTLEQVNEQLKPCPFCGGSAAVKIDPDGTEDSVGRKWAYTVSCNNCIHFDICKGFDITSGKYEREICAGFSCKFDYVYLPCKAGDTIFMLWEWYGETGIATITVLRVVLTECGSYIETDFDSDDYDYCMMYNFGRFWFEDFGKIVFTTKEEAEKELAERSRK